MVRDSYSYWLEISGEDAARAAEMMDRDGTLVGGMVSEDRAEYQVDENEGTIEEWKEGELVMLKISTACPKAALSLLAINEDDHSIERRTIYAGGSLVKESNSRVVGADDVCDMQTARDIVQLLADAGETAAAELVTHQFLNTRKHSKDKEVLF